MADSGAVKRMGLLEQSAVNNVLEILQTHQWVASIKHREFDGEYLIIEASKASVVHRVALMYSSATRNDVCRRLSPEVEVIFIDGELYKIESYAYGISTPVRPIKEFLAVLFKWNELLRDGKVLAGSAGSSEKPLSVRRSALFLQSENPLGQVWSQLRHYGSVVLAKRLIVRRCEEVGVMLPPASVQSKAEGVAYAIRNATDYFRTSSSENLSQRVLNYYYGCLAFAFAEMLSMPLGPATLAEIEDMTKQGHGLYTVDGDGQTFEALTAGVLATGFFPQWMKSLGYDTTAYPRQKPKSADRLADVDRSMRASLVELLARVPELRDIFTDAVESPPLWWHPFYASESNARASWGDRPPKTYIELLDESGRTDVEGVKALNGPISEIEYVASDEPGVHFRVAIDHPGYEYWQQALKIHKSPFVDAALIAPVFGGVDDYRALAFSLLYALSIVVRYRPSLWRRVQEGDWDQYKVLTESFLDVVERVLPEEFLKVVTGLQVVTRQPGAFV